MASVYKSFTPSDIISTRTQLHEAIPLTGTIVSGTYSENNIKNYSHGMFQSVYDYPYLSSSSNHIFDIAVGYSNNSNLSASTATQNAKKINMYNQMAQVLVGHDETGAIREFDEDGNIIAGGTKMKEVFFINFSRLLVKDEIKKGSYSMIVATGSTYAHGFDGAAEITLSDSGSITSYKSNSPAGEYGFLYVEDTLDVGRDEVPVGLIYYQAGICVLTASVFSSGSVGADSHGDVGGSSEHQGLADVAADAYFGSALAGDGNDAYSTVRKSLVSGSISGSCNGLRNRIKNIQFNNTTELHSTIYFCRINHNEYNYSANPTYLTASKLRVKQKSTDKPVSYVTGIGLYSQQNELLAVAKLSEPLKKTPVNELTLRVRLDY